MDTFEERLEDAEDRMIELEGSMAEIQRKQQYLAEGCSLLQEEIEDLKCNDDVIRAAEVEIQVRQREIDNMWKRINRRTEEEKERERVIKQKQREMETDRKQTELREWEKKLTKIAQIVQAKLGKYKDVEIILPKIQQRTTQKPTSKEKTI